MTCLFSPARGTRSHRPSRPSPLPSNQTGPTSRQNGRRAPGGGVTDGSDAPGLQRLPAATDEFERAASRPVGPSGLRADRVSSIAPPDIGSSVRAIEDRLQSTRFGPTGAGAEACMGATTYKASATDHAAGPAVRPRLAVCCPIRHLTTVICTYTSPGLVTGDLRRDRSPGPSIGMMPDGARSSSGSELWPFRCGSAADPGLGRFRPHGRCVGAGSSSRQAPPARLVALPSGAGREGQGQSEGPSEARAQRVPGRALAAQLRPESPVTDPTPGRPRDKPSAPA